MEQPPYRDVTVGNLLTTLARALPEHEALVFRARVGDREVDGIDLLRTNADGLVTHLTVFVRPLSGLLALAEAMKAKLAG